MTELSRASGIARAALSKALRPGVQPRFDTIARVMSVPEVRLLALPVHASAV
jgi:DNA-binding phage protein